MVGSIAVLAEYRSAEHVGAEAETEDADIFRVLGQVRRRSGPPEVESKSIEVE
ncbi:hypothetical protein D3C84_1153340 [compost metagenome]